MNHLQIIGRTKNLFAADIEKNDKELCDRLTSARVLVCGGAGSIGKELVRQLFARNPRALHVIDISENNLTELVRDIRSSLGYIEGDTQFLPVDMGSVEAVAFFRSQSNYDYVFNMAALKHVRSEKDAFSLMRMIKVNILDTLDLLRWADGRKARKFFAVSTDKAKNPANLMGATKRIAEDVLFSAAFHTAVSTARFANVAFSDGSLLHGFRQRILLHQPISAPRDVRRYFVTGEEAGMLCLLAGVLGNDREIYFPQLSASENLLTFSEIAVRFLEDNGYEPVPIDNEALAREVASELIAQRKWPVVFFDSDTSGEKPFEEFYSLGDKIDWRAYAGIGVIENPSLTEEARSRLASFLDCIATMRSRGTWDRAELVAVIRQACPELSHIDTGKFLDNRM